MILSNQEILNIFNFRYACKKFKTEAKIPDIDFKTILEAARLSPTSCGLELFKILVIQDNDLRQKMLPFTPGGQKTLLDASHFIVLLYNKMPAIKPTSTYIKHMLTEIHGMPEAVYKEYIKGFEYFALHDLKFLETEQKALDWSAKQTYIVLANMLMAAAIRGIDSAPIEGFNLDAITNLLGEDEKLFDANQYGISVMAAFGYRDEEPRRAKTRRPLEDIILWK